ncbi:MAG: hypothetical protein HOV81_35975 [Kofleriaceae bacterium]|nr:hypothetical protein [Kofleriaceae bacterium]
MMKMCSLSLLVVAACASGGHKPVVSPEARDIKATEWSKRDAAAPLWPETAKRVQVIVTGGWSAGEHFVWVVAEGTKPVAVYHVGTSDLADMRSRLGDLVKAELMNPLLSLANGGQGVILGPPPPPPIGPLGFPLRVVNAVVSYAAHLDRESQQLDRELLGAR